MRRTDFLVIDVVGIFSACCERMSLGKWYLEWRHYLRRWTIGMPSVSQKIDASNVPYTNEDM